MSEESPSGPPGEPKVLTFGCRLNIVESELMRRRATEAGLNDAVIINSCAVTGEAERQVRQAIRRARRESPAATIIVAGCAAQLNPERFADMDEVDRVLGNSEKLEAASYAPSGERVRVNDIMEARELAGHLVDGFAAHTRAFVQVQQGCDHRCTFCIIPFARGPSRSMRQGDVERQVRHLVEQGVAEVVLTGVDLTSYGSDLPGKPALGTMMTRLLAAVPDLPRLRLSSVDSVEIDEDLFRLLAEEPRLMPHLHLSLQAGHDLVLQRMKRRHLRQDVIDLSQRVRSLRPDVVFGADFIAGFPTETEEHFQSTLDLVEEAGLTWLHVFPYSERPDTPAVRMPTVPKAVRKERAARLRAVGDSSVHSYLKSRVGSEAVVLVESSGRGRCEHYAEVEVAGEPGELVPVDIVGVNERRLVGQRS